MPSKCASRTATFSPRFLFHLFVLHSVISFLVCFLLCFFFFFLYLLLVLLLLLRCRANANSVFWFCFGNSVRSQNYGSWAKCKRCTKNNLQFEQILFYLDENNMRLPEVFSWKCDRWVFCFLFLQCLNRVCMHFVVEISFYWMLLIFRKVSDNLIKSYKIWDFAKCHRK